MEKSVSDLIEQKFAALTERINDQVITRKEENAQIDEALKDDVPELRKLVSV